MNKMIRKIDYVLSLWCIIVMGALTASVIVSVTMRYVFRFGFVQAEEAITMMFIATTFFGGALGVREEEHISINYLKDKFSGKVKSAVTILALVIIMTVGWFLFRYSLNWISRVGDVLSPSLRIPNKVFYSMVPVSSVFLMFYCLIGIAKEFLPIEEADPGYEKIVTEKEASEILARELEIAEKHQTTSKRENL